jgi:zinc carboxypeptidase
MARPAQHIHELTTILNRIPDQERFPGPDEVERRLAAVADRHPGLARRRHVGMSRLGEPIHMVSIGSGSRDALVFAGPHPNEPAGFLTVPYLAELLCADEELRQRLDHTWHLIGCVDPDGARLNESWYAGPFTRRHYARRFFRPAIDDQVEWTFPSGRSDAGRLPETRALKEVIDTVRPDLMCSLHNAEFGGVYYYVTDERPGMAEALADLSASMGVPLQLACADLDLPDIRRTGPGVFVWPSLESVPQGLLAGNSAPMNVSSLHYARRYGTFSLIVEVPLWADARSADGADCGRRRADVLAATAETLADISPRIGRLIDRAIRSPALPASPFTRSLAYIRRSTTGLAEALRERAKRHADTRATVAEQFTTRQTVHVLRLRSCGTAIRLLDEALVGGDHTPAVRAARAALDELFGAWADEAEAEAPGARVPLARLLGAQLGAILTAATH